MQQTTTTLYLLLFLVSCNNPAPRESTASQDFFPLHSGNYSEFLVEKTRYLPDQKTVAAARIRRSVESIFQQPDGQQVFPITYASITANNQWQTDSTHAAWLSPDKAFEQENGKIILKMHFPLSEHSQWDFNAYNNADESVARATRLNKPFQVGTQFYPNTVSIVYQDDSTLLSRKKYIEIYAADVGLIYSERLNLRYCHEAECIGKGIIESGSKEVFTISKTGKQ
ncbi:hypothetical protein [Dyadobacter crusticola]|uniref:hypothetical protein n=1 Tax=Dyadobacter crusticola TaxID=292407 RepID=UPI000A5096DF|nr:hypothetical protein [Dyadobacter crusticola]